MARVAEAPRKSVGPGFELGRWSFFSCRLSLEQCLQRSLYKVSTNLLSFAKNPKQHQMLLITPQREATRFHSSRCMHNDIASVSVVTHIAQCPIFPSLSAHVISKSTQDKIAETRDRLRWTVLGKRLS